MSAYGLKREKEYDIGREAGAVDTVKVAVKAEHSETQNDRQPRG